MMNRPSKMSFRECRHSLFRFCYRVAGGLFFCLAGFLLPFPADSVCKVGDFYRQKVTGSVGGKMDGSLTGDAASRKSDEAPGGGSAGEPGGEKAGVDNVNRDNPGGMYSNALVKALNEAQHNPKESEEILVGENTPLALCYRAYLRESGVIASGGPEDSAEALLNMALRRLPPELSRQAAGCTDWGGSGPTMNRIINTLFMLHVNHLKPE